MKSTLLFLLVLISLNSYCQNLEKGNLGKLTKENIFSELQNLTGEKIDSSKTIVINFYDKPEKKLNSSCIDNYTSDYEYKRYFKRNRNILQFYITQKGYKYKKRKVIEDKNNTIRNLIFQDAIRCGNYIIIKANGEFLKKIGEYRQDQILELIQGM